MDIIECPAPGESEADPQFPPHEAGVLGVFASVICCRSQVNSPHMPVLLPYRQTDTELRPGRPRDVHFTSLQDSSQHGSEVAIYVAIPCG